MKKALTKVLLLAVTLVIFAAIIPLSASASTSDNKNEVFKQLTTKLDLNPAAACGVMANIERESNFDPTLVITDSNGLPSGGLCQWNGGRFNNLKNYCRNFGYDHLTIEGQIAYLSWEMASNSYGFVYDYLKSLPNNADGAYKAAWYWCYYFEIPSDRATKAAQRANNAKNNYWPDFGVEDLKPPLLSLVNKKNPYDIDHSISFKWSDAGDDATDYFLIVAGKNNQGKYDWSKAAIRKFHPTIKTKTVGPKTVAGGDYAAYVRAYNSKTGKIVNSNFELFTVKCLSHDCVYTVVEPATFDKPGKCLVTCKQCPAKAARVIPQLTDNDFKNLYVSNFRVTGYTDTRIRFHWTPLPGVDGYQIFQSINNRWVCVALIQDPNAGVYILSNLQPNAKHGFTIRGYKFTGPNTAIFTKHLNMLTCATRPDTPVLTRIVQIPSVVRLDWQAVSGVDGYAIYMAEGQDSSNYKLIAKIPANGNLAYLVKNLKKGQFYYFHVRTYMQTASGYAVSNPSEIMYVVGT